MSAVQALLAQLRGIAARLVFVEELATRVVVRATGEDITRDGAAAQASPQPATPPPPPAPSARNTHAH